MNGVMAWVLAQVNTASSVVSAIAANKPAPARQVVIYTVALIAFVYVVPKIVKAVSK